MTKCLPKGGSMSRIARVIVPEIPHHIIQRGNRNQTVFFKNEDRRYYLRLLKKQAEIYGLKFWAYCLMDNHVHLIAVPKTGDSFMAVAETHRRYSGHINLRNDWRGHLWQDRFSSYPLDERYLYAAVRYVERNPVRAGVVSKAWEYPWSSARFHVYGEKDYLVENCFLQERITNWEGYLSEQDENTTLLRKHRRTGRPLGQEDFIKELESTLGRVLIKSKPGPKGASKN